MGIRKVKRKVDWFVELSSSKQEKKRETMKGVIAKLEKKQRVCKKLRSRSSDSKRKVELTKKLKVIEKLLVKASKALRSTRSN